MSQARSCMLSAAKRTGENGRSEMFFVFDFGRLAAQFRWDYDRFFFDRWCLEAYQALLDHPDRTLDPSSAEFCLAAATLRCVSFAAVDRAELANELSKNVKAAAGKRLAVFDWTDQPKPIFDGNELVICKSAFHESYYDPVSCVSIPQFPRCRFTSPFQRASQRRHLAGFKGNPRPQYGNLRERLLKLDDGNRFVVKAGVFMPRDVTISADGIASENPKPGELSYTEILLSSTFAQLPRACGYALSYRMIECMNAGCVPVIISDGYVLPFSEVLDYSRFSIRVGESDVERLPELLDARLPDADRLQAEATRVYEEYFSSTERIVHHTLKVVATRIRHTGSVVRVHSS